MTYKEQLRTAIQTRDADGFKHLLSIPTPTPTEAQKNSPMAHFNHTHMLYELAKEEPTHETLSFLHSNCWTLNLLYSFGIMEIHAFITNKDFQPTILDCYSQHNYSIEEMLMNVEVDENMIPERFEKLFFKYKNIIKPTTKECFVQSICFESEPEFLALPFLEWALKLHEEVMIREASYFRILECVHKLDPQKSFEIIKLSNIVPTKRERRMVLHKEILKWIEMRDINRRLSINLPEKGTFKKAKI